MNGDIEKTFNRIKNIFIVLFCLGALASITLYCTIGYVAYRLGPKAVKAADKALSE